MNWYRTAAVAILLTGFAVTARAQDAVPQTILMDGKRLAEIKTRIEKGDPELKPALDALLKKADAALQQGPYSVTDKEVVAPSGDKHDYASYSRYWWPDPEKPDGLPYIRRDGETNPDSQSLKASDRQRIEVIGTHNEALGLAYYFTGERKYAQKAAQLLRVWFLDPATRMNPNLNHAQCRRGHNTGTKSGVLDGRMMVRGLEGSLLLSGSSTLSDAELQGIKDWVGEYLKWLQSGKLAIEEAAATNNHGSFYDAQTMYFALYCGNKEVATKLAKQAIEKRIFAQIKPDGTMPEELARTRPNFYSNYNLHALFVLAHLAKKVDVNIWNAGEGRLRAALDYLAPYADPSKPWPHDSIKINDRMNLFPILKMADQAYPDGNYMQKVETLPLKDRQMRLENLAFPLMR